MAMEEIDPLTDPRWEALVDRAGGGLFHSAPWLRSVSEGYGFEMRAMIVAEGDDAVAGLPFVRVDGVGGRRIVVGAFSDFCDPLVVEADAWQHLADWIDAAEVPVRVRSLHWREPTSTASLRETGSAHWHALEIADTPDALFQAMDGSARRAIRKSAKSGVEVDTGSTLDHLRAFHALHVEVRRRKYRLLAQPYGFFEAIWRNFVEQGRGELRLASVDGTFVAGVLFLDWCGVRYYKFNASHPDHLDLRPNDGIVWSAVQAAVRDGIRSIDFGLSDWDQEGLARYKAKFGAGSGVISFLEGGRAGDPPDMASAFGPLTELLTHPDVPVEITTRAGEVLYRWFA